MVFRIHIDTGRCRYALQVERCYAGNTLEKFRVTGGGRSIVLQSNRPGLQASGAKKRIDWKLLEGTLPDGNLEAATYALYRIMKAIEDQMHDAEEQR